MHLANQHLSLRPARCRQQEQTRNDRGRDIIIIIMMHRHGKAHSGAAKRARLQYESQLMISVNPAVRARTCTVVIY